MPLRIVFVIVMVTLLAALLLGAVGGLRMRRVLASRASRTRTRRGLAAEPEAEKLLKKRGYRVIGRRVGCTYDAQLDGESCEVTLIADLLVERDGRELVAEVKTGQGARFSHIDTRRQLLEYQLAFRVPGILLVDADAGTIREVSFPPFETRAPARRSHAWLAGSAASLAIALLAWWFLLSSR